MKKWKEIIKTGEWQKTKMISKRLLKLFIKQFYRAFRSEKSREVIITNLEEIKKGKGCNETFYANKLFNLWNEQIPTKLYLSKLFQEEIIECLNSSITIKVTKPIANKISSSPLQRERNLQAQMVYRWFPVFQEQNVSLIQIF